MSSMKAVIIKGSQEMAVATQSWILRGLSWEPTVMGSSFTF